MHDIFVTSAAPLPGYPPHSQWIDPGPTRAATYQRAARLAVTEYFWVVDPIDGTTNYANNLSNKYKVKW
jgi:hypothetical protein